MKISYCILGLLVCIGAFGAGHSEAYVTTNQTVKSFNSNTELFTITYRFGAKDRDFYLPISAFRDVQTSGNQALGYTILNGLSTTTHIGTTTALVLSQAAIKDGRYVVPAGTAMDFTLVVVWQRPAGTSAIPYRLRVSSLPFTMNIRGATYENRLNPSELQYYTTPLRYHITASYTVKK
jgi:hypothetical protein